MPHSDLRTTCRDMLERGDKNALVRLLGGFLSGPQLALPLKMVNMGGLEMLCTAVDSVAMTLTLAGPSQACADLAGAVWDLSSARLAGGVEGLGASFLFTACRCAGHRCQALGQMGRWQELLDFSDGALALLARYQNRIHELNAQSSLQTIRTFRIEALQDLGRLVEASTELHALRAEPVAAVVRIRLDSVARTLEARLASMDELPQELSPEQANAAAYRQNVAAALDAMVSLAPEMAAAIQAQGHGLLRDVPDTMSNTDLIERLASLGGKLQQFSLGGGERPEVMRVQERMDRAIAVLADPRRGHDNELLRPLQADLAELLVWYTAHGHASEARTCRWMSYVCANRVGEDAVALEHLRVLWAELEQDRRGISDPRRRAGVFSQFPHLFPCLVSCLLRAGQAPEALAAMEAAKGRALGDALGRNDLGQRFANPSQVLPGLLAAHNAHYLSFFVDQDETFMVLLSATGDFYTQVVSISRATLRQAAANAFPRLWDSGADPFAPAGPPPPPEGLLPVVAWLGPLLDQGVLHDGDHICYSPDDALHLLPLHYAQFRGAPLVRTFGLSRVHGANLLVALLSEPARRPASFTAVTVPGRGDAPEVVASFQAIAETWAQGPAHRRLSGQEAAGLKTASVPLAGQVVHFATHGFYPQQGVPAADPNPWSGSGLFLPSAHGLPDIDAAARGLRPEAMLSPKMIADVPLDFTGAHVSLQACVSGLAREGVGGDALGLELALFMAGAQSTLASHWNVSASASAAFFQSFYSRWLQGGGGRGQAWRQTVLDVMGSADFAVNAAEHWAAFSLGGDFR